MERTLIKVTDHILAIHRDGSGIASRTLLTGPVFPESPFRVPLNF